MMAGLVLKVSTTKIPSRYWDSHAQIMLCHHQTRISLYHHQGVFLTYPLYIYTLLTYPSQQFSPRRRILFTVKVVRADIDLQTRKPVNALKYNRVVTVPIYNEDEAYVPHIVQ